MLCGDTGTAIPLYRIPYTYQGDCYDNVYFWWLQMKRLSGLWFGCYYDEFTEAQMSDVDSIINKKGRELCTLIESLTGVPTYYFLFNNRTWTTQEDLARKCPVTGRDWRIEGKTTGEIAFKCDESRLVSELSFSCEDRPDGRL